MNNYYKFTDEQLDMANRVNLVDLMRRSGYHLKRAGCEYTWESPTGKVSIRGNSWYHQYERTGGKTIGFLMQFHGMEFKEAVEFLLSEQGIRADWEEPAVKEEKTFELPPKNSDMNRVYAYLLNARFLDREIVDHFVHAGLIYEDAKYHNVVFVGLDEEGRPKHASKRGSGKGNTYKGNVYGSDDRYCFRHTGKSNKVYVFESPIDLMAYLSMNKENWKEDSYITLCSAASEAAVHFLKNNPQIDTIYSCLDHDEAGINGVYRLAEEAGKIGDYQVIPLLPEYKDWNEGLKTEHGIEPLPAQKHPGLERMKILSLELTGDFIDDPCPKYPLSQMGDQYNRLKKLVESQTDRITKEAYWLSGTAFLFAKKLFEKIEVHKDAWEYGKLLFSVYQPHRDRNGYRSRVMEIGESLMEIRKQYTQEENWTKDKLRKVATQSLYLSVECLKLCMFIERKIEQEKKNKKQQETEEEMEGGQCMS